MIELQKELLAKLTPEQAEKLAKRTLIEKRYGIEISDDNEDDKCQVSAVISIGDKCFVGYGSDDTDALADLLAEVRQEEQTLHSITEQVSNAYAL